MAGLARFAGAAAKAGAVLWIPDPDAEQNVAEVAHPALETAAAALARTIPEFVPVHHGTMQRLYRTDTRTVDDGRVEVLIGSPFWHWLEYGTQWNPPYRPIQRAAQSLGLAYTPT
jgi:hypothetical protein